MDKIKRAFGRVFRSTPFPILLAVLALLIFAPVLYAVDSSWRLFDSQVMTSSTGTAAINSASATYTNWQPLITITPQAGQAMQDCKIVLDLDQASTGFASQFSSGTITVSIGRQIDGTHLRTANNVATTALAGSNASGLSIELNLGLVGPTEIVTVQVKVSAITGIAVTNIPYVIYYRSQSRATVTAAS